MPDSMLDTPTIGPAGPLAFVHTADWQLGMTRKFLSPAAQARFDDARIRSLARIGERVPDAEFVLGCGDLFDSNDPNPEVVARCLDVLAELGCPVLMLPGNHDPLEPGSVYLSAAFTRAQPPNVILLGAPGVHTITTRTGRIVEVLAAPWLTKVPDRDPLALALADAPARKPGVPRIAAGHGNSLALGSDPAVTTDMGVATAALGDGAVDYIGLGDRHSATEIAPKLWFSGAPEVTNFDAIETDSGNVLAVTLETPDIAGGPLTVTPVPVGEWAFHAAGARVENAADVAQFLTELEGRRAKSTTVVRYTLEGELDAAAQADLEHGLTRLRHLFAGIHPAPGSRGPVVLTAPTDIAALGLGGYAQVAAFELAESAAEGDTDAKEAIELLYRIIARDRAQTAVAQ